MSLHRAWLSISLVLTALMLGPALARAAVVTVAADKIVRVDGEPFFPIMQWAQCGWRVEHQSTLGINTFVGNGCSGDSSEEFLDDCQASGAWGVVDPGDMSVADHPALLGWIFGDEPDLDEHHVEPDDIQAEYDAITAADPDHVTFLTVTARFYSGFDPPTWMEGSRDRYVGYGAASDLVGFDHYPVYGWCRPDWIDQISDAQDELVELYAPTPATYQWIECSRESGQWCELCDRCASPGAGCGRDNPCEGDGLFPAEVRNEVWQAIVHGATAIGYFTHAWECPDYTQFCVTPELEAELLHTNAQITALTGPLLSPLADREVAVQTAGEAQVDLVARRYTGALYIFAVNKGRAGDDVTVAVADLSADATVDVLDEGRRVTAESGSFTDRFEPLAVHIYMLEAGAPPADAGVDAAVTDGSVPLHDGGDHDAGGTGSTGDDRGGAAKTRSEGCRCGGSSTAPGLWLLSSTVVALLVLRRRREAGDGPR